MKRWLRIGCASLMALTATMAADDDFSRAVRPEDFAAAGLGKLTPEELVRLNALVRDFKGGVLKEAEARAAQAEVEARAAKAQVAQQAKTEASRWAQLKEKLSPRAAVEIEPIETRIKGRFTGWQGQTVFYLENGERWQVSNSDSSYYTPPIESPAVKIEPASFGGFWMTVVEIDQRVRVKPMGKR